MRLVALLLLLANVAFLGWQLLLAEPDEAPAAKPGMVGAPMLLWSEWNEQQERKGRTAGAAASPEPAKRSAPPTLGPHEIAKACFTVGPFSMVSDVSQAASLFDGKEITTQQRAAAARRRAGYWVYIPPQGSLQGAREVLRYLQSKGVEDALIIAGGSKENSISVGVFSNPDKADRRQKSIARLGYDVEVEPLYRTQPQYWLDLELWKGRAIPAEIWANMERKFPSVSAEKRSCQ